VCLVGLNNRNKIYTHVPNNTNLLNCCTQANKCNYSLAIAVRYSLVSKPIPDTTPRLLSILVAVTLQRCRLHSCRRETPEWMRMCGVSGVIEGHSQRVEKGCWLRVVKLQGILIALPSTCLCYPRLSVQTKGLLHSLQHAIGCMHQWKRLIVSIDIPPGPSSLAP